MPCADRDKVDAHTAGPSASAKGRVPPGNSAWLSCFSITKLPLTNWILSASESCKIAASTRLLAVLALLNNKKVITRFQVKNGEFTFLANFSNTIYEIERLTVLDNLLWKLSR